MSVIPPTPVVALSALGGVAPAMMPTSPVASGPGSFAKLLIGGIDSTNSKLVEADRLVRDFAIDDSIPVHQVTLALEQARLSLELMLQVRGRLLDGYQQLMNMQL